jgi:hypothetical protein
MKDLTEYFNYVFCNVFSHYINGYFEIHIPKSFSNGITTDVTKVYPGDCNVYIRDIINGWSFTECTAALKVSLIKVINIRFTITEHEDSIDIRISSLDGQSTYKLVPNIRGNPYQEYLRLKLEHS